MPTTRPPHTLLIGGAAAQPYAWLDRLRPLTPPGVALTACEWGQEGWWSAFTQPAIPAPWTCLLLVYLGASAEQAAAADRLAETQARAWLAHNRRGHRLFYLDLVPGENSAGTETRLSRALGYTRVAHRNNHANWQCNGCSDPDCERQLFSALVPRSEQGY